MKDSHGVDAFETKTLYLQEMFQRGILTIGTFNLSDAHSAGDMQRLVEAHREVLPLVGRALQEGTVRSQLRCDPLVPLFKVR